MADNPLVFDRALAKRRLRRALDAGYPDFLLARVAEDLDDRLAAVLRRFDCAVDLAGALPVAGPALLARSGRVLRMAEIPGAGADLIGDLEALPFAPASLDLVASLLALHGVNDMPGALVQIRRALRPDGLFIGCLLAGRTLHELRQVLLEAEIATTGGASPRIAPFADLRDMGTLLQRAGFALPVVDSETVTVRYGDMLALMRDLRALGWTNALRDRKGTGLRRDTLVQAAEIYADRFSDPDGRLRATFEIVWLSGWAPHDSQQKPLRPGSAKARLADALGVPERGIGGDPR